MSYPYANGTIKALETKVLDRNKLFVLTKYDKEEFVKVLLAMNYGSSGETVEELITNELIKVKKTIDEITPDVDSTNLFYLINDAQNIKILYKMKNFQLEKEELLQDNGSISSNTLLSAILKDDLTNLDKRTAKLIKELNEITKEIENPKDLSNIIDQTIYKFAMNTNNDIIKNYLTMKIDFTNIISMLRAKNLKWSFSSFLTTFIQGGKINKEVFENVYDKDFENQSSYVIKSFEPYYNELVSKVLSIAMKHFELIEVSFSRLTLNLMGEYRNEPFNIGPMLYYYLLKLSEAQNIRLLYSANEVELRDLI